MKRLGIFFALLLACGAAVAQAPPTTTINGTVFQINGDPATGGRIVAKLSIAGLVTVSGVGQTTIGASTVRIGPAGTYTLVLIPNDQITPAGTYYTIETRAEGQTTNVVTQLAQVPSSPDPATPGDLTYLNVGPGVHVGPFVRVLTTSPGDGASCVANAYPAYAIDTDEHCECTAGLTVCVAGGGGGPEPVCKTIENLTTADLAVPLYYFVNGASTITGIGCDAKSAITLSLQDATPTDVDANLVCSTGGAITLDSSFTGTATFTNGEQLQFDVISGAPAWTTVCFVYTTP